MSDEPRPTFDLDAFRAALDPTRGLSGLLRESTERAFQAQRLAIADGLNAAVSAHVARMSEVFEQLGSIVRRSWEEGLPPNWRGLDPYEVVAVMKFMARKRLCLAWTPRREIVDELLATPRVADRNALLHASKDAILSDLDAVLDDVVSPSLELSRAAACEAIEVFDAGHVRAAQALAAVVFTDMVHTNLGGTFKKAREFFDEREPEQVPMSNIRLWAIMESARSALERAEPVSGRPARSTFNRHASLHRISKTQYTERNALVGLMLVVPMLREVDFWLERQRAARHR